MRLVICNGAQYDADNLPAHVPADECVPADEWFRKNRVAKQAKPQQPGGVVSAPPKQVESDADGEAAHRRKK